MDNLNRPHTAFWIPVWLYVPKYLDANGQPRPILRGWRVLNVYCFYFSELLSLVAAAVLLFRWKVVDGHLCPNIIPCNDPCIVKADPDITGIGVRVSAYVQAFCGTILLGFSSQDTAGVRATIVITSLTLVATTGIYGLRGQLSLHHAVVVETLLSLVMLPMHLVESWRVHSPALFFAQQIRFAGYIALSLWLVVKAPCLGSDPQCNMCTKTTSFFFLTGHATNNLGRSWNIFTLLAVSTLWANTQRWTYGPGNYLLTVPALFSNTKTRLWQKYVSTTQRTLYIWRSKQIQENTVFLSVPRVFRWYDDDLTVSAQLKASRWAQIPGPQASKSGRLAQARSDSKIAIRVPRVQRSLIGLLLVLFWAIATERVVKMNISQDANEWGFGQIFSLIMSVPAVASLIQLLLRTGRNEREVPRRVNSFP